MNEFTGEMKWSLEEIRPQRTKQDFAGFGRALLMLLFAFSLLFGKLNMLLEGFQNKNSFPKIRTIGRLARRPIALVQ